MENINCSNYSASQSKHNDEVIQWNFIMNVPMYILCIRILIQGWMWKLKYYKTVNVERDSCIFSSRRHNNACYILFLLYRCFLLPTFCIY